MGQLPGLVAALACCLLPAVARAADPPIDFQREIRPILADTCYTCHGNDQAKRKTALRFDSRKGAFADLGGYHAIVPGHPEKSMLIDRIVSTDPDERMPPPDSGRQLTPKQIDLLRRWIAQGAQWQDHWAFVVPKRPALPTVRMAQWPRNDIDRFVLAKLEQERLKPSPEASKETLLRRVTLDLTGLPPTIAELDAFLADKSPDAYEKVVDRLLASPRYGEQMAVDWLDAARYSDTNGYQLDGTRTMWPWRDWVVNALNRNMPFDQFTIEQLAGDMLPNPTESQRLATGFHRNHPLNGEGGRDPEESRVEYVVDRVDTTATVWLGLTAGCARCHDHKYDPIAQREFYQLYAFFNSIAETGKVDRGSNAFPLLAYATPTPQLEKMRAEIASLEKEIRNEDAQREGELAKLETEVGEVEKPPTLGPWRSIGPFRAATDREAFETQFGPEKDGRPAEQYAAQHWTEQKYADGQVIPLAITDFSALYLARTITAPRAMSLSVSLGSDDGIQVWLNGRRLLAHNQKRAAAADQEPVQLPLQLGENFLLLKINNGQGPAGFYFAAKPTGAPVEIQQVLAIPPDSRNAQHREALRRYLRAKLADSSPLRAEIADMRKQEKELRAKSTVETMVMQELPTPRDTYVLIRGQFDKKDLKQKLEPLVPACLPPLPPGASHNRLGLARWLVDPVNPLTARVTVNHYWQQFFGIGLVKTTEDFGSQGEPPSHPELLDWLATEFIARHWDVKAMHRMIVTSATYRQSSRVSPDLLERDMYNRLLARGPRFRLSSFALRDQALAVAGLLVDKVGGPPVKPYQPDGVWQDFSLGKIKYVQDHGENLYRRSVYTFWRRSVAPTMLFDTSPRQVCTVKASRTNTPLHALTLLNDVTFVEAARALAQRVMLEGEPAPAPRIDRAFRLATARHATPQELEVLTAGLRRAEAQFRNDPAAVKKLLAEGESPRDKKLNEVELAAYTSVMNVILNLDEVLTKE